MTKTHRVETIEEYNTDGKLIRKTVTEENEKWFEDQPNDQFYEELTKKYAQYPYTNPCTGGPSDSTSAHN